MGPHRSEQDLGEVEGAGEEEGGTQGAGRGEVGDEGGLMNAGTSEPEEWVSALLCASPVLRFRRKQRLMSFLWRLDAPASSVVKRSPLAAWT